MQRRSVLAGATILFLTTALTLSSRALAHGDVDEPTHEHHAAEGPPDDLPYVAGSPAPKGYHYERGPRRGAMIAGVTLFAIGYLPALGLAIDCLGTECRGAAPAKGWETALAIPVAGPVVYALGRCTGDHDQKCYLGAGAWIVDAALQAASIGLFLHGTRTREIWIRDDVALAIAPSTYGARGAGLSLFGAF